MKKYIKVEYWEAQKFQDEDWYEEECYSIDDVVFIPEELYNEHFKGHIFKVNDVVIWKSALHDYPGIIININDNDYYPVIVLFNNGETETFTLDGKFDIETSEIVLFKQ